MANSSDLKKAGNVEFRCYFQLATMVIGGKWKPKVLFQLAGNEAIRFGELRRAITGITEKMLIQSLKELEKDGLVHREVYRQVPPKVEYSLTEIGKSFVPILYAMFEWGKSYASYLFALENRNFTYQPGDVFDDLDKMITIEIEKTDI